MKTQAIPSPATPLGSTTLPPGTRSALSPLRVGGRTTLALWRREIVRFLRQRGRVSGALAQPLLFWGVIGSGLDRSFHVAGASSVGYREYFFPGVLLMVVLFTSIFTNISLIEDRQQGVLQVAQVAPVPSWAIVAGKTLGGASLGLVQALLLLLLAPLAGFPLGRMELPQVFLALMLTSVALTTLGFSAAWVLRSTQGFHAVMSVLLLPLWILSGSMFPAEGSPFMQWVIRLNPLSYAAVSLRRSMYGGVLPPGLDTLGVSPWSEWAVLLVTALALSALAAGLTRRSAAME